MIRLFVMVLIVAMPLMLWLLTRKARLRADAKSSHRSPARSTTTTDKTQSLEVEPDRLPLAGKEKKDSEDAEEKLDAESPAPMPAGVSDQLNAGPRVSSEANDPKLEEGGQAGSEDQTSQSNSLNPLSLPPTETALEPEAQGAEIAASGIICEKLPEEELVSTSAPSPIPGDEPQAGLTIQANSVAGSAPQLRDEESTQTKPDADQTPTSNGGAESADKDSDRAPLRYRPPLQRPPRPAATRVVNQETESAAPSEIALEIRVRLTFDRFGSCEIALLPGCTSELDNEVDVKFRGIPLRLVAQDDWYQDLRFETIGDILRDGLELRGTLANQRRARWLLTGRDVYVLASHQRASGFVSTNRLALGRSHVVLCAAHLLPQVEAILNEAGCQDYARLGDARGVPLGWVGLRGVAPTKAIALNSGVDPFYAIKPTPDIEIELEGGVCLRGSAWLAGFPPRIRLLGQVNGPVKLLIDGKDAHQAAEGSFIAEGYDFSGQHFVYCEGLSCSRSYSIEEPPDSWQVWPAYRFGQADMCGPLVQLAPAADPRPAFTVPMSNPLLLGAEPGQIFRCTSRSVASWRGLVPFDVVWALPSSPLSCIKKTSRILQFADDTPIEPNKAKSTSVLRWSAAILDASRKGLRIENGSSQSSALWMQYKKMARKIRRAAR
jgi:hypothetical protein